MLQPFPENGTSEIHIASNKGQRVTKNYRFFFYLQPILLSRTVANV